MVTCGRLAPEPVLAKAGSMVLALLMLKKAVNMVAPPGAARIHALDTSMISSLLVSAQNMKKNPVSVKTFIIVLEQKLSAVFSYIFRVFIIISGVS